MEVVSEWLVLSKYAVQFTSCELAGIVGGFEVGANGEYVFDILR